MKTELLAGAANAPQVTISDWRPHEASTLRGFFTSHLPSGMSLHENSLHYRDGQWWVMPPSKPMVGRDGMVLRDGNGKPRYTPIVTFGRKEARERFNANVIAALRLALPEVFEAEAARA
jgi:hypothetical protein